MTQRIKALSRRRVLLGGAAVALAGGVTGGVAAGGTRALARKAASPRLTALEGLDAPVDVFEDEWGVPHVRAASVPDAFLPMVI